MTCYFTIWQLLPLDVDHNPYKRSCALKPKTDIFFQIIFRSRIIGLDDELWQFIHGIPDDEVRLFHGFVVRHVEAGYGYSRLESTRFFVRAGLVWYVRSPVVN